MAFILQKKMYHKKQLAYLTLSHDDGLCNMQIEDQLDCPVRLP
jgi:hypothetical protein